MRRSGEGDIDPECEFLERKLLAQGRREQRACLKAPEMLSLAQAATVSGISARNLVRMRREGRLLALALPRSIRGHRYPKWQFEPEVTQALPTILQAFGRDRMWQAYDFLTYPEPLLAGRVPLDEMRADRTSEVLRILGAANELHHGAY